MLKLVYGDTRDDSDVIPFPRAAGLSPRGRLVGTDPIRDAEEALERAQAQLDELRDSASFPFLCDDEGPRAA